MAAPLRLRVAPWIGSEAEAETGRWVSVPLQVALVVAVIATLARVALPLPGTPVPVTLQDLGVLLVGILMGPRRGALAVATYVGVGALGAPVFANGHAGLAWLMGPTGGYLLAFPMAAFVVGWATHAHRTMLLSVAGVLAAQAVLFLGGALQLGWLSGWGMGAVMAQAVLPFLPGVAVKSGLLISVCAARAARRERSGSS